MKKAIALLTVLLCFGVVNTLRGQGISGTTYAELVKQGDFVFEPDPLQMDHFGNVQGQYANGDGFPLWLLLSMNGPVAVNGNNFAINRSEVSDSILQIDLTCIDSLNGACELQFAIDPSLGKAALTVITPQESVTYLGTIYASMDAMKGKFKNAKAQSKAVATEALLDRLVAARDFTIHLNPEAYGKRSYLVLNPDWVVNNTVNRNQEKYKVICMEKLGDKWYVRLEYLYNDPVKGPNVMDLLIDATTGDVNYRFGVQGSMNKNWRYYTDGNAYQTTPKR